ncbi:2-hydroxyacid dehydrogenase [Micavibrio aeruginosavorus]|uniref:D-isomer specific 2-hydroxyacid dehydrogenase, NAD binding domain protein n=1 Tax=Micavibrio aeruginosavorus (strain ARL-13) TaxID=856793 RepID=G2KQ44_MICAA|nr:glyoxylate/hydroxypyruvate reductase A [Micavibrio aeruginosavorus]AEP08586.1 D-isomer specific 2-hydroxyacid dehydrogenase, NAD binding domain protein [Micavibrio aeruginosavorus ARL-13]
MAILFRPVYSVDNPHWVPALRAGLADLDMRIWPDVGNPSDITHMVAWKMFPGDRDAYPNLRAVLSLSAGVNQYIGHPEFPHPAKLIRMIEPGLSSGMVDYVTSYVLRFHRDHDLVQTGGASIPWGGIMPTLAKDRVVGILGLGEMGGACARALAALGFRVRGWARTRHAIDGVGVYAGQDQLPAFLKGCDILVCLLPLTPDTENILNRDVFAQLPRGACLINAARGKHLVEDDLIPALDSGQLRMAALDVFRTEPLPADHAFWSHPRILVTPHIAAITIPETGVAAIRQAIMMLDRGEEPPGLVDFERGY